MTAACSSAGGGTSPATTSPATTAIALPEPLDTCGQPSGTWTALAGSPRPAAASGSGPVIVFANQSGNRACDWTELATALVQKGFRTVVFSYTSPAAAQEQQSVDETLAVARAASGGAAKFGLVGASLGGRVVIEAAAKHPDHLGAIVSLSGESQVQDYPDILAAAAQVTTPTLYVGSTDDPLTQGRTQQDALHQAMHGQPNTIVQVPGTKHGTQLVAPASGENAAVVDDVVGFLHAQLQ